MRSRSGRRSPVVFVAAATQLKLGLEEPWIGSDLSLTLTLTSLSYAAPLIARRRWPVAAAAVIAAALPIQAALGGSLSFGSFAAVLVAAFSVGRNARPRTAALGAAIILLGIVLGTRDYLPADVQELIFPLFYVSAATSIGATVRRMSEQASKLRELNAAVGRRR